MSGAPVTPFGRRAPPPGVAGGTAVSACGSEAAAPVSGSGATPPAHGSGATPPAHGSGATPPAHGSGTTPRARGSDATPPARGGDATPPASWAQAGADWPGRVHSRFLRAGGITWHVQISGAGPVAFLVHGTGASTHSWRGLAPLLAEHFTVVAADLPGHGFTEVPGRHLLSLPGMARDLAALLGTLGLQPAFAVGHSAGAAILARMCLDRAIAPAGLVSLNGAFLPLAGAAGQVFAPLARLLVGLPVLPQLFAWRAADPRVVDRLLAGTGSRLDAAGVGFYSRLVRNPRHAAAALRMMANWDLAPLVRDLPGLTVPLLLLAGDRDRAIPPGDALRTQAMVPGARAERQAGLGHLAHEEDPAGTAALVLAFARSLGVA